MTQFAGQFAIAIQHYGSSNLADAERVCREIIATDPNQPQALHLLGLIASKSGRTSFAIDCMRRAIQLQGEDAELCNNLGTAYARHGDHELAASCHRRAIELQPDFVPAHSNLANVLRQLRRLVEAIQSYREAVRLAPDSAEACRALGSALIERGEIEEGIASCRRALMLMPNYAEAYNDLGNAFNLQGKLGDALAPYQKAIHLKPDFAEAYAGLGDVLKKQNRLEEAVECCRRAVQLNPSLAEAHNNLGNAFKEKGQVDEAVECYGRALRLKPDVAKVHYNLGLALRDQNRLEEAVESFRQAIELDPNHPDAHNSLGNALRLLGKRDQAAAHYERALQLTPDLAIAHVNLAGLLLLEGNFGRGWAEYEWRFRTKDAAPRTFPRPLWDGSSLGGKTILVHAEQGFGDTFQFIRYAALVKQQQPKATILVECQRQLIQLLARCRGIDHLVASGDQLPPFDVHSPLLSLPRILKTTLETIPANIPYVFADSALIGHWRNWLNRCQGPRIGINWEGRSGPGQHQKRNIPIALFAALAQQIPGTILVPLQKGEAAAELARITTQVRLANPGSDFDTTNGPFMDTAAIMMNLDLVITSDTSVAHLAGALGVPVWVALPFVPDWRWLLDRSDSPWYPTMRLFRQKQPGDWTTVFQEIRSALQTLLSSQQP